MVQSVESLDWQKAIPTGQNIDELFNTFKEKAEAFTVKVIRCASSEEAESAIVNAIKEGNFKKVVSVPLKKVNLEAVKQQASEGGIEFITDLNREVVEQADLGITEFSLGISTLGTVIQDATDVYDRLVSALPPTHLAIINTNSLVPTFEDSLEVIQKIYGDEIPNYMAFITGPSKTADIERVLTIGVHGPEHLIIVCVD